MDRKRIIELVQLLLFILFLYMKPTPCPRADAVEVTRCIEREREALLKFKEGLVDNYGLLSSWGSDKDKKDCCKWVGVACSNRTGHVILLDLHDKYCNLGMYCNAFLKVKFISPALLELHNLQYLNLNNVDFGGSQIPKIIGHFRKLRHLILNGAALSGNIPCELGNLTTLQTLDLSYNQLDGPIPASFGEFVFLEELDLNDNLLKGGIPNSFMNISHLRTLNLCNNNLSQAVPELFQRLPGRVEVLLFSNNQLFGPLPDITHFLFLKSLYLSDNKLNGFLPQNLTVKHSSLFNLVLLDNQIAGSLPDLTVFPSLAVLDITRNQLKGLSESIWQLSKLNILRVGSNMVEGTITEAQLSNKLVKLRHLDLSFNSLVLNLSSDWVPPFQAEILLLGNCRLGPHFPKWLHNQITLAYLDLSYNDICDTVPKWLWKSPSIEYFNLSHNHINDKIPDLFPFWSLYIDLSHNRFRGPVPPFPQNMFLERKAHIDTSKTTKIWLLDFSNNQLSGELPDCWIGLVRLKVLNLASNNFEGKIPEGFGSLYSLETLHLRNNNFIGEIPSSLKNCTQLRMLDLGENELTGSIPAWIGLYLKDLTVVSLRFNNFHGNISPTICKLNNILILDLSHNNMSGQIPHCFNNFTTLGQKESSTERISGVTYYPDEYFIDNAFVYWKGQDSLYKQLGLLKSIDLSSNRLAGTIPQEISYLRGLISLNLSRNHLTGNIISSIGKMEMLESLDLSTNKLSGEIPIGLAQLNFLSFLDISNNNLTGKIPLSTQLQSFNSSAYAGNKLCGAPLTKCPGEAPRPSKVDHGRADRNEEDNGLISTREFYLSMALGFFPGFWAVVCTLFFVHSWRNTFFRFLNRVGDWMYVTTTICARRLWRKLRG